MELKELPNEDVEAKLCCFLIPNEEVVKKSSSLEKVLLIEWYLFVNVDGV